MSQVFLDNKPVKSQIGNSLFELADKLSVRVPTSCSRNGECHECIVEINDGMDSLSQKTVSEKFLRGNFRLACQAKITNHSNTIDFSVLRRQPKILSKTMPITDNIQISPAFYKKNNKIYSKYNNDSFVEDYRGAIYGLAVDIGTTTVVMNLIDLENYNLVYTTSFENPQRFGGSDIMNRISYDSAENNGELKSVIVSAINFEIGEMVKKNLIRRREIYDVVVVGNTTMREIFFGFDVTSIGTKPYKSIVENELIKGKRVNSSLISNAKDIGLRINPNGIVYGAPIIASHIGSDISADLIAIDIFNKKEPVLLVDVGTNTEIILGMPGKIYAASCPAGPAFEGGDITYGMPGYDGAIEKISIMKDSSTSFDVIGDSKPIGICGSGLIDLLAELKRSNLMNDLGRLKDDSKEFVFSEQNSLSISNSDISSLAQAKAANYCGQAIILKNSGVNLDKISNYYLAGGFANYINIDNAIDIGFLANIERSKIEKIGNASLLGACKMLLSTYKRVEVENFVLSIEHIELETSPDFFDFFVDGCMFKPMD
ncbi:MAG: ASKHA domain-containing protein [Dehalococcoidia bacterium]